MRRYNKIPTTYLPQFEVMTPKHHTPYQGLPSIKGFQWHITKDASPTLSPIHGENMHSHHGALSESLYLYQPALNSLNEKGKGKLKSILSLGIGLAYNEMIFAAEAIRGGWSHFYLESFENQDFLLKALTQWLQPHSSSKVYPIPCLWVSQHYKIEPQKIRKFLHQAVNEGKWKIRGALDRNTSFDRPFHCILFDAYSSQTSPELWTEEFLSDFLAKTALPHCIFSTYAATGSLTRSLNEHGFKVTLKKGFGKKRACTWAQR